MKFVAICQFSLSFKEGGLSLQMEGQVSRGKSRTKLTTVVLDMNGLSGVVFYAGAPEMRG